MAGIYRKISTKLHADEKFRQLSTPRPCGRYLWYYLLTNKFMLPIPGVIPASEIALADDIGWLSERFGEPLPERFGERSLEGFRKAFSEVEKLGLATADWSSNLVFLPRSIKHNPPDNPNVIKSWAKYWDSVPECDLKLFIFQTLRDYVERLRQPFVKAFQKGFAEQYAKQGTGAGAGAGTGTGERKGENSLARDPNQNQNGKPNHFDPVIAAAAATRIVEAYRKNVSHKGQIKAAEAKVRDHFEANSHRLMTDVEAGLMHSINNFLAGRQQIEKRDDADFRIGAETFFSGEFEKYIDGIPESDRQPTREEKIAAEEQRLERYSA